MITPTPSIPESIESACPLGLIPLLPDLSTMTPCLLVHTPVACFYSKWGQVFDFSLWSGAVVHFTSIPSAYALSLWLLWLLNAMILIKSSIPFAILMGFSSIHHPVAFLVNMLILYSKHCLLHSSSLQYHNHWSSQLHPPHGHFPLVLIHNVFKHVSFDSCPWTSHIRAPWTFFCLFPTWYQEDSLIPWAPFPSVSTHTHCCSSHHCFTLDGLPSSMLDLQHQLGEFMMIEYFPHSGFLSIPDARGVSRDIFGDSNSLVLDDFERAEAHLSSCWLFSYWSGAC